MTQPFRVHISIFQPFRGDISLYPNLDFEWLAMAWIVIHTNKIDLLCISSFHFFGHIPLKQLTKCQYAKLQLWNILLDLPCFGHLSKKRDSVEYSTENYLVSSVWLGLVSQSNSKAFTSFLIQQFWFPVDVPVLRSVRNRQQSEICSFQGHIKLTMDKSRLSILLHI